MGQFVIIGRRNTCLLNIYYKGGIHLKKFKIIILIALLSYIISTSAFASEPVTVQINKDVVSFPDQPPYISDNRTMVPVHAPMEAMGCKVDWNDKTRQATITNGSNTAVFTIGSNTYTVNGETKTMDTQAVITGNRTAFPVRFAAEAMGATVNWDPATNRVLITTTKKIDMNAAENGTLKPSKHVSVPEDGYKLQAKSITMTLGKKEATVVGMDGKTRIVQLSAAPYDCVSRQEYIDDDVSEGIISEYVAKHTRVDSAGKCNDYYVPIIDFLKIMGVPSEAIEWDGTNLAVFGLSENEAPQAKANTNNYFVMNLTSKMIYAGINNEAWPTPSDDTIKLENGVPMMSKGDIQIVVFAHLGGAGVFKQGMSGGYPNNKTGEIHYEPDIPIDRYNSYYEANK